MTVDESPAAGIYKTFSERVMVEEGVYFPGPQVRQFPRRSWPWVDKQPGMMMMN